MACLKEYYMDRISKNAERFIVYGVLSENSWKKQTKERESSLSVSFYKLLSSLLEEFLLRIFV